MKKFFLGRPDQMQYWYWIIQSYSPNDTEPDSLTFDMVRTIQMPPGKIPVIPVTQPDYMKQRDIRRLYGALRLAFPSEDYIVSIATEKDLAGWGDPWYVYQEIPLRPTTDVVCMICGGVTKDYPARFKVCSHCLDYGDRLLEQGGYSLIVSPENQQGAEWILSRL